MTKRRYGLGLIVAFVVMFSGMSYGEEFGYKKHGNTIEFKAGGEIFLLKTPGGWSSGISMLGIKENFNFLQIELWKERKRGKESLFLKSIKEIKVLLDNEETKKIKVTTGVVIMSKSPEGKQIWTATPKYEIGVTCQIWKNIPAISTSLVIKNLTEDTLEFRSRWINHRIPNNAFYTTRLEKGIKQEEKKIKGIKEDVVTKPIPYKWIFVRRGECIFLHQEEQGMKGLGIITNKRNRLILSKYPYVFHLSSSRNEVSPEKSTPPFEVIFVPVKKGYSQLEDIAKKIKASETMLVSLRKDAKTSTLASGGDLGYTAAFFESPLIIDANLADWEGITPIIINKPENIIIRSVYPYQGKDDLSCKLYLGYDKENLYLALETFDNIFYQGNTGTSIWKGDCIQFTVDSLYNKGDVYQADDYEYGFALTVKGPEVWCWRSPKDIELKDIHVAIKKKNSDKPVTYSLPTETNLTAIDHGLIYEAKIPFKYLFPFNPEFGTGIFGFNFLIMDDDGYGVKQYLLWSKPKEVVHGCSWKIPDIYGKIILSGKGSLLAKAEFSSLKSTLFLDKDCYTEGKNIKLGVYVRSPKEEKTKMMLSLVQGEEIIYTKEDYIELKKGLNNFAFTWPSKGGGEYKWLLSIYDEKKKLLSESEKSFFLLSPLTIKEKIADLKNKSILLKSLLEEAESFNIDTSYPKVAWATINAFVPTYWYPDTKYRYTWLEDEVKYNNLYQANKNTDYLLKLADKGITEIKEMIKDPKKRIFIPKYDLTKLNIKDGFFYSGDMPCFFFGPVLYGPEDIVKMSDLGFNLVHTSSGVGFAPCSVLGNKKEAKKPIIPDIAYLDKALKLGVVSHLFHSPHYFPRWALKKYPEIIPKEGGYHTVGGKIDLENLTVRSLYEKYFRTVVPLIQDKPALLSHYLACETKYNCRNLSLFQKYLKESYKNINSLNKTWHTGYKVFNEIPLPPENVSEITNFPQFQDWCFFNQETFFNFWNWQKSIIREYDKKRSIHAGTHFCSGSHWQNKYRGGIDRELISTLSNVIGCDGDQNFKHRDYACDFWDANFGYDLLHSFGPSKALIDSEWHPINPPIRYLEHYEEKRVEDYLRTGMWMAYLRGVGVMDLWVWWNKGQYFDNGKYANTTIWGGLTAKPSSLYSCGRTALEIKRLANYLVKFHQNKPDVALLYSLYSVPSLIKFPSSHEPDLRIVYEGTSFLDTKVTFVSERQIANGLLNNYKLIIISSAKRVKEETYQKIKKYVRNGGTILISGNSLRYNEYEKPRDVSSFIQGKGIKTGNLSLTLNNYGKGKVYYLSSLPFPTKKISQLVDALLEKSGVERYIRVLTPDGKNAFGVESRTVKIDKNRYLAFLININKKEVKVNLKGGKKIKGIKNLITGEEIKDTQFSLPILEPMLLEIMN